MRIRLIGSRNSATAFARVNQNLAVALEARGHTVLDASDGTPTDAVVVHDYARRVAPLAADEAARGARRVLIRTWDFGPYPRRWAQVATEHYDEMWVYSRWNAELAVRGGVPEGRVHVVPLGIDTGVMRMDGPRWATGGASTTFLWVGATVQRKGYDLLDAAYRSAFGPDDDVELVVKDNTRDVFYRDQHLGGASSANDPAITYLDDELAAAELASLYRAADALVLPFRAEGFALPTLEAMACGTAPLVSRFGAVLDHCDDRTAWFVPVRRVLLPVDRVMTYNSLGFEERVHEIDLCEPNREALVDQLRQIAAMPASERDAKGRAAAQVAAERTWDRVAAQVEERLAS